MSARLRWRACFRSPSESVGGLGAPNKAGRAIQILTKPVIQMLLYERIILKMRICPVTTVELRPLPRREFLFRVEAPRTSSNHCRRKIS